MSEEKIKLFKFITETLKDGKDLAAEQIPDLITEILVYDFYNAIGWIIFGLIMMLPGLYIANRYRRWADDDEVNKEKAYYTSKYSMDENKWFIIFTFSGFFFIFGFFSLLINVNKAVYIKAAPKSYLVDKIFTWNNK